MMAHQIRSDRSVPEKIERVRDEAWRRYTAAQPCIVCGRTDVQAAHENYGHYTRGLKAGDDLCFPFCLKCHRLHDEKYGSTVFWKEVFAGDPMLMMDAVRALGRERYAVWLATGRPKP